MHAASDMQFMTRYYEPVNVILTHIQAYIKTFLAFFIIIIYAMVLIVHRISILTMTST